MCCFISYCIKHKGILVVDHISHCLRDLIMSCFGSKPCFILYHLDILTLILIFHWSINSVISWLFPDRAHTCTFHPWICLMHVSCYIIPKGSVPEPSRCLTKVWEPYEWLRDFQIFSYCLFTEWQTQSKFVFNNFNKFIHLFNHINKTPNSILVSWFILLADVFFRLMRLELK